MLSDNPHPSDPLRKKSDAVHITGHCLLLMIGVLMQLLRA
jgi:hypothetical protein